MADNYLEKRYRDVFGDGSHVDPETGYVSARRSSVRSGSRKMKVTFRIAYNTRWGESLCLVQRDVKYPMSWTGDGIWQVSIPSCSAAMLKDYYYVVMQDGLVRRTEWDHHSSALAASIVDSWIDCPVEGCHFPRKHSAAIFDTPGMRGAGTAVPIFSLRTGDDFGIGEFRDLHPLIDWAASTGQCIIQLLPINDTTRDGGWGDSYPYSPVSSFALHPLYIRLQEVGVEMDEDFARLQKDLNDSPELDYPRVFAEKMRLLRAAFSSRGAKDVASPGYKSFCKNNSSWLGEYCAFCAQRDSLEPDFYAWVQYHLDKQLGEEVAYAHSKGVYLKGDLPIGVSRDSADAHFHPELFNLDSSAGAPPDFFSKDGQNWGFPTYNWEAMALDDYAWWKARLRNMAKYFDAFRIDHILGFFRIWEIPIEHRSGQNGHFNPALPYAPEEIAAAGLPIEGLFHEDPRHPGMYQPLISPASDKLPQWQQERFGAMYNDFFYHRNEDLWRRNAERKLPELLGATGMLACGEDLGMVPDCVPGVMEHEKILSLRMRGFDCKGEWKETSVCATSSHDCDTLRMQCGADPEPWQCRRMLEQMLSSPSMLAIFPIQDWLSIDGSLRKADYQSERINHPEDPDHHWRYRLHIDLQKMCTSPSFCTAVCTLVKDSGRFVSAELR